MSMAKALRALLDSGENSIAPEAYSALTARIVESVGFPAAYVGGHPIGQMHYAIPNCGVLNPAEAIEQAGRIVEAISIPIIVDADSLGETVAEAYRSTRRYEQVGVAGIHVEDQVNPNHSPYANGLLPIADMQFKLEAAVRGRRDDAFVIIARCDAMFPDAGGNGSLEEAIKRGRAYAEAGADAFLVPPGEDYIETLAQEVPLPIINYGNPTPGAALSISTGWGVPMAARLHQEMAQKIFDEGRLDPETEFSISWEAPFMKNVGYANKRELIDQQPYDDIIIDWARGTGRSLRTD